MPDTWGAKQIINFYRYVKNIYDRTMSILYGHQIPDGVSAHQCMLASERVLAKEWDTPEEDEAWKEL